MTPRWCEFVHGLRHEDLPGDVQATLRNSLVDTIGVAAVGRRSRIARTMIGFVTRQMAAGAGAPSARLLFDGRRVSPTGAALAGASLVDSIDAHDGHSGCKGHAGSAVLPSLLAFAD
ncbi:MAG: MmgE/PrpD family protein, partial [Planctomycetes bacterium]|nr:MmgE/PrpD family protein [Planctomycetota bacterium]